MQQNQYKGGTRRMSGWDYRSKSSYFITICTDNREWYFGELQDGEVLLSPIGRIAEDYWKNIPSHFPEVTIDDFVLMPNHLHGILHIDPGPDFILPSRALERSNQCGKHPKGSLQVIVNAYKGAVTRWCSGQVLPFKWQARFDERRIRSVEQLQAMREYIEQNPQKADVHDSSQTIPPTPHPHPHPQ